MSERCGYCGRFMADVDYGAGFGSEWVCSNQEQHIADDPAHWSIGSLDVAVRVAKRRAGLDPNQPALPATFIDDLDAEWTEAFWRRQVERVTAPSVQSLVEGQQP